MANREKGGRVVFIGNIPYGVSEEQITETFSRIGAVQSFRLVYDKETGKPKGFGFLEYGDVDAAASAVRNLNGFEMMGRELKVDYSNDNSGKQQQQRGDGDGGSGRAPPPAHFNAGGGGQQYGGGGGGPNGVDAGNVLPQLPPGTDLPPGLHAPDAISRTLANIPIPQLLDIMSQMKGVAVQEPQKATQLLAENPQLSYAIFQALILLGLVDTNILASLLQQQSGPPPQQQAPAPQQQQQPQSMPPMPQQQQQPNYPPQQQPSYAQQPARQNQYAPPPPQQQQQPQYHQNYPPQQQQHPGYVPTPPAQHQAWQPPQPPQPYYQPPPQQQQPQHPQPQNAEQAALFQQVLSMTRDQILSLDEGPRNQILALRGQLGAPVS